jgi:site-specific recombinase XerD
MARAKSPSGTSRNPGPRSLHIDEWPEADRRAWEEANRPTSRFKPGGAASHLAPVSRYDFANRYGAFLGFLQRTGRLNLDAEAAAQVTLKNVQAYIADLAARVRSVTVYNAIYKLRRAAELLAPNSDFKWLASIESDLALVMEPRSKFDRLVFSGQLVKAGLTLIAEAQEFTHDDIARARGIRNGFMIALLAVCPIRLRNFAALEIGNSFKQIAGRWWIALPSVNTKSKRPDERCVPEWLNGSIGAYLVEARPVLIGSASSTDALWISSTTGRAMTKKNLGLLISKITLRTLGVNISPHLFRTAAASTAATYGPEIPHLASAVLNHTDPRITEEHYNRASTVSASKVYAEIVGRYAREELF